MKMWVQNYAPHSWEMVFAPAVNRKLKWEMKFEYANDSQMNWEYENLLRPNEPRKLNDAIPPKIVLKY